MALIISRSLTVLVLAIFAGACAQKSAVAEVPEQPTPVETKELVPPPPGSLAEQLAKQKVEKEAKSRTLEQEIVDTRETRKQRNERLDKQKEAELERLVYEPTYEERQILARAAEIDAENARKAAENAKQRGDSPAMRQARREAAKAERVERRNEKAEREAILESAIEGCDPATVEVMPRSDTLNIFALFPVQLNIRVLNRGNSPVTIETPFRGYGPVVRGLCSGGSINVSFKLRWEDPQMVIIPIVIRTTHPNGRVSEESRQFFLNKFNANYNRIDNQVWSVDLSNR